MKILRYALTFIALAYTPFAYLSLTNGMMSRWIHFIIISFTTTLEAVVIYLELQEKFPMVVYDDRDYEPTCGMLMAYYTFYVLYLLLMIGVGVLSVIFIVAEENVSIVVLQLMSFMTVIIVTLYYIVYGLSQYSGNAYVDFRLRYNHGNIDYSWLPFSLTPDQMKIYKEEYRFDD